MEFDVYFDESGDLGWKLSEPYRRGGSSRFFTIAYLIVPSNKKKYINRFFKKFHKDRGGIQKEIKGADFSKARAKTNARKIINFLEWNSDIILGAITVKKSNVPANLANSQNDNILYNYMVQLGICNKITNLQKANIIPDKRSVPSGSQNSCADLIKAKVWLELKSNVEISYNPQESQNNTGIMMVDWIANFVWRNYESEDPKPYQFLRPFLEEELLFWEE